MGKFIAKLTGELDGSYAAREFNDFVDAQTWLRGEGLREFDDQTARGEIFSANGKAVWFASHLRAVDRADRDRKSAAVRFLSRFNLRPRK
jgi:hypothetical protein